MNRKPIILERAEEMQHRSEAALADRRARGEVMTYRMNGWMVREFPGGRIVRLCPEDQFDPAKFPLETSAR